MRKVLLFLGAVGLWVFAAFGVLAAVTTVAGIFFGYQIKLISTGSMVPTLPIGSAVLTQERSASTVEVGDIVAIDSERLGAPVIHRVTEIEHAQDGTATIHMQGDANTAPDPFPYENVAEVSAYVFHVPGVAEAIAFLGQPLSILGVGAVASVLIFWAFWPRKRPATDPAQSAASDEHDQAAGPLEAPVNATLHADDRPRRARREKKEFGHV
ncbi:signal peptidase I [Sediminivirga luteola]|uniref:Signal peptidase I n=1 Tax=Sediminivirga luteola TaxID=1774748 RepID=A0A8J2U1I8_9MICO|nr:signal peptidase I [Sediminivirga luteola]GGA28985.1 hypothetical protein GCM10011333_34530 [Sediminivirga luteola]